MDLKKLVDPENRDAGDDRTWFRCDPAVVYPEVIERIQEVIKSGELPQELVDNASPAEIDPRGVARMYLSRAKAVDAAGWKYALQAREKFTDPEKILLRAEALEIARLWFTQALHVQVGGNGTPLGVHWTNSPAFKL